LIIAILFLTSRGLYSFAAMMMIINLGALLEFYRLVSVTRRAAILGVILGSTLISTIILIMNRSLQLEILLIHIPIIFTIFLNELYTYHLRPFENLSYTFFGIIYITLPMCFFCALAFLPLGKGYNAQLISAFFLIIWASDTGAYLVGNYFGKTSLFKRISPHKTREGSIGGIFSAILIAVFLSNYFLMMNFKTWLIWSAITAVTGIFGDLFKSMLKRSYHVKDMGNTLPGHGGILDRFDSLLGSAPFAFSYLLLYGEFKN